MSHDHKVLKSIRMNADWILVDAIEESNEIGGIIIPHTARPITQRGFVMACKSLPEDPIQNEIRILFKRNAAFKTIDLDGFRYHVMKKHSVLCVLTGVNALDVQALGSNVFLRWELAHTEYDRSGIIRPEAYRKMHYTGHVISIGKDVKDIACNDRVFFDQFCGVEMFEEDSVRYAVVRDDDIYCTNVPMREEVLA